MAYKLKLDHAGIGEVLRSAGVSGVVNATADAIAEAAAGKARAGDEEIPVAVRSRTAFTGRKIRDGRAAADVVLMHPAGQRAEAKHGFLAGAAASQGLQVKGGAD